MKNLYRFVVVALLTAAFLTSMNIARADQAVLVCCNGTAIPDAQIDGRIGSEWNDASIYPNISIDPQGTGQLWVKDDGTYLYIALQFQADSSKSWVCFQFGNTTCMSTSADGALFGDSNYPNVYEDISFNGNPGVVIDQHQDGVGAMVVNGSNYVTVELKKPLNSGDTTGKDIDWTVGQSYAFLIEWDSNGGGSSGGTTNHSLQTSTTKTVLLSANSVPEFPSLALLMCALLTVIALALLVKIRKSRFSVGLTS